MKTRNKKWKKTYIIGTLAVLGFFLVVVGVATFFYYKYERENAETIAQVKLENKVKNENRLNLYYVGLKNIPFLQGNDDFVVMYERYLKNTLKLEKLTTSIMFSNYKNLSENIYVMYSQIDDASSTVVQTVYNTKDKTFDFSKYKEKIENIEELGGVPQGGEISLKQKYNIEQGEVVYATIDNPESKDIPQGVSKTIQQYAYEKYRATDIKVDRIVMVGEKGEGKYQIFSFKLDDLVETKVDIYCINKTVMFTMEK